jgi:hypothetical protein
MSAWQPAWRRARRRSERSISWICRSSVSTMPSATETRSRRVIAHLHTGQERSACGACDLTGSAGAQPVVVEHRAEAQKPLGALVDQCLAQMQPRAPLAHMFRGDPRFRQPARGEQLPQPSRVLAVRVGATLVAPQRPGLDRLGQTRHAAGALDRASDEQPARAGFDRDTHLAAAEPPDPILHRRRR